MIRIERVRLHDIAMPLLFPFQTSFGRTTTRETTLVEVVGEGLTGWGEVVAHDRPVFSAETLVTARHVWTEFLVPALLAGDGSGAGRWPSVDAFLDATAWVRGHPMAKAALESALLDWDARRLGISLSARLGGVRDRVAVGVSLGIEPSVEALLARIDAFHAQGYRRIKLKVKPGWDIAMLEAVRARHPDMPLTVDANAAYRAEDIATLLAFDRFRLTYLEQPLPHDDLVDHARLQRRLDTDICLDESIDSPAACRSALVLGAGRVVNIKLGRVGGHRAARQVHDLCQAAGVPVWSGGMLETGIGRAHNVAMATQPNFLLPGDISASDRYWAEDLVEPEFRLASDGTLPVPSGAGIGVAVVPERVARVRTRLDEIAP